MHGILNKWMNANEYYAELCRSSVTGSFGEMYQQIKKVFGPIPKKTALLKESDGTVITDDERQLCDWVEHSTALYT